VLAGSLPLGEARAARRARGIAAVSAVVSAVVLLLVLSSKLTSGAWIVVLLIPLLAFGMAATRRHYESVSTQMAPRESTVAPAHQVTALILVSRIHKPTLRALAYARAARPDAIEAVTVSVDESEAQRLAAQWEERRLAVPLHILQSPFREIDTPILSYVSQLRRENPDMLLTIYVPEYVVTHWWEELLHNQSAARLKRRLMALPNVMVVSVPWQMAAAADERAGQSQAAGPVLGGVTGLTGAMPRIDPDNPPR
jgi:hypothetical protein